MEYLAPIAGQSINCILRVPVERNSWVIKECCFYNCFMILFRKGFRDTNNLITDIFQISNLETFEKHCGLLNTDAWTTF